MAHEYKLIYEYGGYISKKDVTNALPETGSYKNPNYVSNIQLSYLIAGSQNVMFNDGEKVATRAGYVLDGPAGSTNLPTVGSYDWNTSGNAERNLRVIRGSGGKLQYRYVDSSGTVTYRDLMTGLGSNTNLSFAEWWSSTDAIDELIFVNGTPNLYMWSGAIATFASATTNTITRQGTNTWAQDRFLQAGTRTVVIDGITYTYTGGETTSTLTGVTPDPTAGGISAGDVVHQGIRTTANVPGAGVNNRLVMVFRNQLWVSDATQRVTYVSKNTDYTNFGLTSPRAPGDPALLTFDTTPNAYIVQNEDIYISGGYKDWYKADLTLSQDLASEMVVITKLKASPRGAAQSQDLVCSAKNSVMYVSQEPTFEDLSNVESIITPTTLPISDPIKTDFDGYNFTNGHAKYWKNRTYIALPAENKVLIWDHMKGFWHPPQILPVSRLAIIGGLLYGHSSQTDESYQLFTGTNDNGQPVNAVASFAYRNYGKRMRKKRFDEWATEGYISTNTTLNLTLNYDFGGATSVQSYAISGADESILFTSVDDNSFGKQSFGKQPLGSSVVGLSAVSKFRVIQGMPQQDFYEINAVYSSQGTDQQWQVLSHGGNVRFSDALSAEIVK